MHSEPNESNAQIENSCTVTPEINVNNDCDKQAAIFESEDHMRNSLTRICYGDLYVIGRIWIEALKTALLGANFSLIPVVSAATRKSPEPPQKPPPMKYTDLPLYKSPHYEYKDYLEDKQKCPKAKVKILHQHLLPKVKSFRKDFEKAACQAKCTVLTTYCNVATSIDNSKKDFKKMMRDSNNLPLRQGVVLLGGTTGFILGSGKGIPRRLFFTGLGLLSTGALCFPKETDAAFRDLAYYSTKSILTFYNGLCGKEMNLRERVPCKEDLPPPTLPRKSQCPPKKK